MGTEQASSAAELSPGDRVRLRVAVFVAGAAVMAIEVLGTRVIGPHFGSSLFVWTALISVALVALSVGYWVGGSVADRRPDPRIFFGLLIGAALATLIVPVLRRPVIEVASHLGLRAGSLAAAAVLFFPALFLLGMVSPFAVRLEARSLDAIGRSAGRLYALSTAGSVVGAITTGFVLVPLMRLPTVLVVIAASLGVTGLVGWRLARPRASAGVAAALLLGLLISRPGAPPPGLIEVRPSAYTDLRVVDLDTSRYMLANGIVQTHVTREGLASNIYPYFVVSRTAMARPDARRALLIGLGGGVLANMLEEQGLEVESIELDPAVVELARERFGFTGRVRIGDGRVALAEARGAWDVVVIDAFSGEHLAGSLLSHEALLAARDALSDGGLLAINIIGFEGDRPTPVGVTVHATLASVFTHVLALPAGTREQDGSIGRWHFLLFASTRPISSERAEITLNTFDGPKVFRWGGEYPMHAAPDAVILTDDHNSLDTLDLAGVEAWRTKNRRTAPASIVEALWFE